MKKLLAICATTMYFNAFAQQSDIELDPQGNAPGDRIGLKVTESGNNTTQLHIYKNFTNDTEDVDLLTIDRFGNARFTGDSRLLWNPLGVASGDRVGLKITETGNNTTKLHIFRNFSNDAADVDLLTIDKVGNAQFTGDSKILWDPQGVASGDRYGIKITENGNNATKFHIFRNFSYDATDVDQLTIDPAGNIGIGTTTPDAKLTVKGDIHTREVRVDLNGATGPDFVFEEDYNLRSLDETEQFIKSNKHLPEIPSAAEMEENGIELKEMNLKLLQKVEELTLYLIEQNKKMLMMNEEIKNLKKNLN